MAQKLTRWVPPGFPLRTELTLFTVGNVCAFLYSLTFLFRFWNSYRDLFVWARGVRWGLEPGAVMPDFVQLLDRSLWGFGAAALCMLLLIPAHYAYHRTGSQSIYLMRRLPSRWELHRRCLTLPLLGAAICLAAALILLLVYFAVYQLVTPEVCLTPGQWEKLWRVIP